MALHVGAYYFPGYHVDERVERWHGTGWTEWQVAAAARPRFDGHYQPRVPAWGPFDEADPEWGERQARVARQHGITAFIFDWYWYTGPFLNRALDSGFLGARQRHGMKFALMWANHDWRNLHPALAHGEPPVLLHGMCDRREFDRLVGHLVDTYLTHPDYLWIDGRPYFSIYELATFVDGFSSVANARQALDALQEKAQRAGLPGVHINAVLTGERLLPGQLRLNDPVKVVKDLNLNSVGTYVWMHHYTPGTDGFPRGSYVNAAAANQHLWQEHRNMFEIPYYPNVTVGWDSSPRTCQSDIYEQRNYPWLAVLDGNTPAAYETALREARALTEASHVGDMLITINAWNEWTEGSYLLPDERDGSAVLEATRRAFPDLAASGMGPDDQGAPFGHSQPDAADSEIPHVDH